MWPNKGGQTARSQNRLSGRRFPIIQRGCRAPPAAASPSRRQSKKCFRISRRMTQPLFRMLTWSLSHAPGRSVKSLLSCWPWGYVRLQELKVRGLLSVTSTNVCLPTNYKQKSGPPLPPAAAISARVKAGMGLPFPGPWNQGFIPRELGPTPPLTIQRDFNLQGTPVNLTLDNLGDHGRISGETNVCSQEPIFLCQHVLHVEIAFAKRKRKQHANENTSTKQLSKIRPTIPKPPRKHTKGRGIPMMTSSPSGNVEKQLTGEYKLILEAHGTDDT